MKQIYEIGTAQHFTHTIHAFFKKNRKAEEYWVIRNIKYIYANSEEEAKEKYKNWFFIEYETIIGGWRNWYTTSNGVDIWTMRDKNIDIIETKIVALDNKYLNVKYETLEKNMSVEEQPFTEEQIENAQKHCDRCKYNKDCTFDM